MRMYGWSALSAALPVVALAMLLFGSDAIAEQSPAPCHMRLAVELTPDVPDPSDVGFLSSLLDNQVGYRLTLQQQRSGSVIILMLTGPGPDDRCQEVIETLRKDARVLSVYVYGKPSETTASDTAITAKTIKGFQRVRVAWATSWIPAPIVAARGASTP
jgi:hypothetical protein